MKELNIKNYKFILDSSLFPVLDEENNTLTIGHTLYGHFELKIVVYFKNNNQCDYLEFKHLNGPGYKYFTSIKDNVVAVKANEEWNKRVEWKSKDERWED